MRNAHSAVIVALTLTASMASAQGLLDGRKAWESRSTALAGNALVAPAAGPEDGATYPLFILTPTIPVSFAEVTFRPSGIALGQALALGVGATFILGKGTYHFVNGDPTNYKLAMEPYFFFGAAVDGGISNSTSPSSTSNLGPRLAISGFIGAGPVAVCGGYDFGALLPFIGLSTKIDVTTFASAFYVALWHGDTHW